MFGVDVIGLTMAVKVDIWLIHDHPLRRRIVYCQYLPSKTHTEHTK